MLLPRKELDENGNEIDPREELVNKILEYKRFKEASAQMAEMEAQRLLMVKRGNIQRELSAIGEEASEGTEITQVTLFKLMKAFEKAMQKYSDRINKPVHTVVRYNYTMENSRKQMLSIARAEKTVSFEKILRPAKIESTLYSSSYLCWSSFRCTTCVYSLEKGRTILLLNTMRKAP